MKTFTFFLILVSYTSLSLGQIELVEKKKMVDRLESKFQVKKEKKSIKHGNFKSFYKNGNIAVIGHFTENKASGEWIFFDESQDTLEVFNEDSQLSDLRKPHYDASNRILLNSQKFKMLPADIMPCFPGGYYRMKRYLKANLRYPELAQQNNIRGTVLVSFIVQANGEIKKLNVEQGVHLVLNNEAVRLIGNMPDWNPAMIDGQKTDYKYFLPIQFGYR